VTNFEKLLEKVGFDVLLNLNVPAKDLPFSDKRKLQIAIAICSNPEVLLLDDPFSFHN
jgi:ABC-type branched-subunit amino acid transport system ATPase component